MTVGKRTRSPVTAASGRWRGRTAESGSKSAVVAAAALLLLARTTLAATFLDSIISFRPGTGAGFGQDQIPAIIQGPPQGGSLVQGGLDVLSLGNGGEVVVRFGTTVCDGPGPDFVVFENAFHAGTSEGPVFVEAGIVAVSPDGESFTTFPYDAETFGGLAGRTPVLSNSQNGIDPTNPALAGGDPFDLATIGADRVDYLRITDGGEAIADPGNRVPPGNSGGFDLDAAVVLNPCDAEVTPTPTLTASPLSSTPTPTATATATATRASGVVGDVNGDGEVDSLDEAQLVAEMFDGDGDRVEDVAGGQVTSDAAVDVNGDGAVTAADLLISAIGGL